MSSVPFCHLHFHTCYSLLDSTVKIKEAMKAAADMGMEHLAMTDHGALYGAVEFYKAALSQGIKPIIGCDMYVARHGIDERSSQRNNMHLVLLAETQEGYQNLVKLVSYAHLDGMYYKPRIDKTLLRKYSKGLIGLSADLRGEVGEACLHGELDKAIALAREYSEILGENNFFIEIFDHGLDDEKTARENMLKVAEATGLPLVATNDVHYVRQEHAEAHDVLTCLQRGYLVADPNRYRYHGDQFYMKSGEEMAALFRDHPKAISNTIEIARRCNVEFEFDLPAHRLHFPDFEIPEGFNKKSYLVHLGKEGLKKLYGIEDLDHPKDEREKEIKERFYYEVGVIEKTNYINYFLVVADFIQYARRDGVPVGPGRGSGAGSLLAYSLEITTVDPLEYSLIFERFLNPDRVSPPDFDIDFCPTRRADVIRYVREKYGEDCVAQIITFGTLGAKTLMRDLGRVLEIPLPYCDRLAKMIPETPGMTLEKALGESPEFKQAIETEEEARRIMKYARLLEGLPRHTGMHAAGVVIGEKPLIELIPLTREPKEKLTVVQFEKGPTEDIGLLKMDFLGLKNLTIIHEACALIKRNHGIGIDPEKLPLRNDKQTFDLLARGDTVGIFQLESAGMRDTLRQVGPDCIEDVIAILALYRPGPMQFIPLFTKRKHGQEEVQYDHPLLEEILRETYGIIVYQEQIQQAAQILAGFSLGQGDILRRAMGKKKPEVMAEQRGKFVEGCKKTNNIDAKLAGEIFDNIEKFAQYGFNKSHSTAYGFVTFQTAWLKAHYPAEFMAALLSGEMGNSDKLTSFIDETTKEMGIEVLPPCVNESIARFNAVPDGNGIRFGMAAIKGVGEGVVEEIVRERDRNGPFSGLMDFCSRITGANKKVVESLIRSGAFDFTGVHRARLFNGIDIAMGRASEALKDKASGQCSMFEMMGTTDAVAGSDEELPDVKPWSESEMLAAEKELIGFYISGHPLTRYEWDLDSFALKRIKDIQQLSPGERTRIGGMIVEVRKLFTKKDQKPMATFRIEGLGGSVNAIIFPGPYAEFGHLIEDDATVMLGGTMMAEDNGEVKFQIMEIFPLDQASALFCDRVSIHLPEMGVNEELMETLRQAAEEFKGSTPLHICIEFIDGPKVFINADHQYHIRPCRELEHRIEHAIGEGLVYIAAKSDPLRNPPKERRWGRNGQ